jgi:hypothetical protein
VLVRVARWHIFKPKIPIWVNFGGSPNRRCWYVLRPFGLYFNGSLVYLLMLGKFYGYLVYFSRVGMLYQEKSGNPGACCATQMRQSCICTYAFSLESGKRPFLTEIPH